MRTINLHSAALAALLALSTMLVAGCKDDSNSEAPQPGTLAITFENVVGAQPLSLNTTRYTTPAGDDFTVSTFKYYVSNIQLRKSDNTTYSVPDGYFLIDQAKPESQKLTLRDVPAGDYRSITFTLGVDSTRTKAGNFTGALHSDNAMLWEWSQEFINLKLEGASSQSARGGLIFHIVGYKGANGANNTIRTISMGFPASGNLLIHTSRPLTMHVQADVLGMFGNPNPVRFATLNTTMGGAESVRVADNIAASMFSVEQIDEN